jgi:hypothetical protein
MDEYHYSHLISMTIIDIRAIFRSHWLAVTKNNNSA